MTIMPNGLLKALFVACLSISAAGGATAQSAASRIDQPTAATLPPGTSTVVGNEMNKGGSGSLPPPSAIGTSVDVMKGVGPETGDSRANPLTRLSPNGK